jgi:hypothetical protein
VQGRFATKEEAAEAYAKAIYALKATAATKQQAEITSNSSGTQSTTEHADVNLAAAVPKHTQSGAHGADGAEDTSTDITSVRVKRDLADLEMSDHKCSDGIIGAGEPSLTPSALQVHCKYTGVHLDRCDSLTDTCPHIWHDSRHSIVHILRRLGV